MSGQILRVGHTVGKGRESVHWFSGFKYTVMYHLLLYNCVSGETILLYSWCRCTVIYLVQVISCLPCAGVHFILIASYLQGVQVFSDVTGKCVQFCMGCKYTVVYLVQEYIV